MNRRNFIKAMSALATVAASGATMAATGTSPITVPNKYEEALRLYDRCLEVAKDADKVSFRFDQLLIHLRQNFGAPEYSEETIKATIQLLKNPLDIEGIRRIPPTVVDDLYTLALTKMALSYDNMNIDGTNMTQFDWFHETYSPLCSKVLEA